MWELLELCCVHQMVIYNLLLKSGSWIYVQQNNNNVIIIVPIIVVISVIIIIQVQLHLQRLF